MEHPDLEARARKYLGVDAKVRSVEFDAGSKKGLGIEFEYKGHVYRNALRARVEKYDQEDLFTRLLKWARAVRRDGEGRNSALREAV